MLIKGKSKNAFEHNIKTEMHSGKPLKQSLAIAYSMKRRAQHKAHGGIIESPEEEMHETKEHENMEGPQVEKLEHDSFKKMSRGGVALPMEHPLHSMDLVERAIHKRKMAHGGVVADEGMGEGSHHAGSDVNDFDYLSIGDLDDSTTNSGAADGDFLGDEREDEDRRDIVAKIMKKRTRQHNPIPA